MSFIGPQGYQGPQGPQGTESTSIGAVGPQGFQGHQGPTGGNDGNLYQYGYQYSSATDDNLVVGKVVSIQPSTGYITPGYERRLLDSNPYNRNPLLYASDQVTAGENVSSGDQQIAATNTANFVDTGVKFGPFSRPRVIDFTQYDNCWSSPTDIGSTIMGQTIAFCGSNSAGDNSYYVTFIVKDKMYNLVKRSACIITNNGSTEPTFSASVKSFNRRLCEASVILTGSTSARLYIYTGTGSSFYSGAPNVSLGVFKCDVDFTSESAVVSNRVAYIGYKNGTNIDSVLTYPISLTYGYSLSLTNDVMILTYFDNTDTLHITYQKTENGHSTYATQLVSTSIISYNPPAPQSPYTVTERGNGGRVFSYRATASYPTNTTTFTAPSATEPNIQLMMYQSGSSQQSKELTFIGFSYYNAGSDPTSSTTTIKAVSLSGNDIFGDISPEQDNINDYYLIDIQAPEQCIWNYSNDNGNITATFFIPVVFGLFRNISGVGAIGYRYTTIKVICTQTSNGAFSVNTPTLDVMSLINKEGTSDDYVRSYTDEPWYPLTLGPERISVHLNKVFGPSGPSGNTINANHYLLTIGFYDSSRIPQVVYGRIGTYANTGNIGTVEWITDGFGNPRKHGITNSNNAPSTATAISNTSNSDSQGGTFFGVNAYQFGIATINTSRTLNTMNTLVPCLTNEISGSNTGVSVISLPIDSNWAGIHWSSQKGIPVGVLQGVPSVDGSLTTSDCTYIPLTHPFTYPNPQPPFKNLPIGAKCWMTQDNHIIPFGQTDLFRRTLGTVVESDDDKATVLYNRQPF